MPGNHRSTDCSSARSCIIDNCGEKHHSTLHRNQDKTAQRHTQKSNNINLENQVNAKSGLKNQLQFMPITLFNNNKAVPCYIILDKCSSCSYVLKCTADTLQCKSSRTVELSIRGAFSEDTVSSNLVQLHIGPFNSTSATFTLQTVYSVETLNFDLIDAARQNNISSRYDHLRHIAFPNLVDNSVYILLSVHAFWHIAMRENLKGPKGSPYGVRNLLGWTITDPLHQKSLDE